MELPGVEGKGQAVEKGEGRAGSKIDKDIWDGKGLNVMNAGGEGRSCRKKGDPRKGTG